MDFIQILSLIAIWGFPIGMLITSYLKLNKEDREKSRNELKQTSILFSLGIPVIGLLLFFSGIVSGIKSLDHIGALILIVSCFAIAINGSIKKKRRFLESAFLILWGLILIVAYIYLI